MIKHAYEKEALRRKMLRRAWASKLNVNDKVTIGWCAYCGALNHRARLKRAFLDEKGEVILHVKLLCRKHLARYPSVIFLSEVP